MLFFKAIKATNVEVVIHDLNPENFNKNMLDYDQKTAIYCSQLSEVAYWSNDKVHNLIENLNNKYPKTQHHVKPIKDTKSGTQLIFFGTQQYIIIAFRGTEFIKEIKDIILDLKVFRYYQTDGYSNLPAAHGGFRRGIMNLIDNQDIFGKLHEFQRLCNTEGLDNFPIYTTGHSLGAALATLIIEPLNYEKFNFAGCYNFAPPLVISYTDAPALAEKYGHLVYDIVNFLDYIPRAGKTSRRHLRRIGKFYRICKVGIINSELEKRNGKYISYRFLDKFRVYKYHKLSGYVNGVKNKLNSNDQIIQRKKEGITCF